MVEEESEVQKTVKKLDSSRPGTTTKDTAKPEKAGPLADITRTPRELGSEVRMDYSPPSEGNWTCVVMSAHGEPWWNEATWAYGCRIVAHVVVGDGAASGTLSGKQFETTAVKGWEAGWNHVRKHKPNVILVEGRLSSGGEKLIAAEPSWLKLVVASELKLPKPGARHSQDVLGITVRHSDIGGVTDRVDTMACWLRTGTLSKVPTVSMRQDMRAILKAGVTGRKAPALEGPGSIIGEEVVYLRPGLVSC